MHVRVVAGDGRTEIIVEGHASPEACMAATWIANAAIAGLSGLAGEFPEQVTFEFQEKP